MLSLLTRIGRDILRRFIDRFSAPQGRTAAPKAAAARRKPLREDTAYANTVWIPRILWALDWAERNGGEAVSAAELARIVTEQAGITVASPNMARAFRDLKKNTHARGLWSGDKKYRITAAGRAVLDGALR